MLTLGIAQASLALLSLNRIFPCLLAGFTSYFTSIFTSFLNLRKLSQIQLNTIMNFTGIIIAACTFLTIGIWHPIVIKTEYYWGTRPWIIYLLVGLASITAALFIENTIISAIVGVFGASALWGIGELFQQKKRVEKGWFPKNPKRKY